MNQNELDWTGEQLRDEGCAKAEINALHWKRRATAALLSLPYGTNFSSDSLRLLLGDDNPPHHNAWGAVIRAFYKAGNAEPCGYKPSSRPEAHARTIRVFKRIQKKDPQPTGGLKGQRGK